MKTPQLPFPKLATALGISNEIWLKREDKHHYGSHKGRSIPLMINEYRKLDVTNFVISSSGNAALAAILAIQKFNQSAKEKPLQLTVLVGEKINPKKLTALNTIHDTRITIQACARPKQTAFQMEKNGNGLACQTPTKWLRQSTDEMALVGYHELAIELSKIPNLAAVFVPTSSGTTAEGLFEGFKKLGLNPQIHIVQTEECHPMVKNFQFPISPRPELGTKANFQFPSLASAIVDKVAHRKEKILEILKNSRGAGWIATNDEIIATQKLVKEKTGIELSANSALSIVGLTQAIQSGLTWEGAMVCVITGK